VSSRPATLLPGYALLALAWASSAGMCVLGRAGTGAMLGAITAVCAVLAGRELWRPGLSPAAERAGAARWAIRAAWLLAAAGVPWLLAAGMVRTDLLSPAVALGAADALRWLGVVGPLFWGFLAATGARGGAGLSLEMVVLALLWADTWRTHRHGDLARPHFFADLVGVRGMLGIEMAFTLVALILLLVLGLHWLGRRLVQGSRGEGWRTAWVLLAAALLFATLELGLPVKADAAAPEPPPPPTPFSVEPPPPPNPEPELVALVELSLPLYVPGEGYKAYLFRTSSPEPELRSPPAAPATGSTPPKTPAGGETTAAAARNNPEHRIGIEVRKRPEGPWHLPGQLEAQEKGSAKPGFATRLEFRAGRPAPATLPTEDWEDLGRLARRRFGDETWTPAYRESLLAVPSAPRISPLVEEVLAPLRNPRAPRTEPRGTELWRVRNAMEDANRPATEIPGAREAAIREWLEASLILDDRLVPPEGEEPALEFLFGDKTGSEVQVVRAGLALLRAAGIPCRRVQGYSVPTERNFPARFAIFDQHATEWVEIHRTGEGWVPWVIRPRQVISRKEPPPAKTKQDEVLREIDEAPGEVRRGVRRTLLLGLAVAVAGLLGWAGTWAFRRAAAFHARYLRMPASVRSNPDAYLHRWVLASAADLLASATRPAGSPGPGLTRREGETWENFGQRVRLALTETGRRRGQDAADNFQGIIEANREAEGMELPQRPVIRAGLLRRHRALSWALLRAHPLIFLQPPPPAPSPR
jgi:hypothetical protein